MAPFYDFPGQIKDEAVSVAGGRTFQVVQIADSTGEIIDPSEAGTGGGVSSEVEVNNTAANPVPVTGTVNTLTGLEIPEHDYVGLGYTGDNLTSVVYKTGGSGGATVATLALAYDGSNKLISVTRS
jgi:hypothetical protein